MKTQFWSLFVFLNIVFSAKGWAACPLPKSADDVVKCAISSAPDARRAEGKIAESKAMIDAAGQISNPELGADYLKGKDESELSLSLQFPVSELIVRGSKKKSAQASASLNGAQLISAQSQIKIETIVILYRLKQLYREIDLISEALGTFEKLVKQYQGRAQLTPEQELSLAVFQMAENDYKLQKSTLSEEESAIANFFILNTGFTLDQVRSVLPLPIAKWPSVKGDQSSGQESSDPMVQVARAELEQAEAEASVARMSGWSDIKVGPLMKRSKVDGENSTSWGAGVSLPLPLFNLNGGERRRAIAARLSAELNLTLAKNESVNLRNKLTNLYNSNVQSLQSTLSSSSLSKHHERVDKLFLRGIVSSSLVIEAHRQLIDLEKSRNEKERMAIESLWSLRALDGRIFEESL